MYIDTSELQLRTTHRERTYIHTSRQSSKSIRSSGGSSQLVNDQSVLKNGANASASVTITFQKGRKGDNMDVDSEDDVRA